MAMCSFLRLCKILMIVMGTVHSKRLVELATVKCDGRGNFVVAMEYGLSLVDKTSLRLDIKACQFVVIALTETIVIKHDLGNYLLTILGYDQNNESIIKDSCFKCKARKTKKRKVLDCNTFKPFWLSWNDKRREFLVGEGEVINKNVLLRYRRRDTYPLYFLQLTSGKNIVAEIKMYDEVNDMSIQFETPNPDGTTVVNVLENAEIGTSIYTLKVNSDPEPEFDVTVGSDAFKCNGSSLQLAKPLDYETRKQHFVTIKADSVYASLTVNVLDFNDNTPVIKIAKFDLRMPSDARVGYVFFGFFTAVDADYNDTLTYRTMDKIAHTTAFVTPVVEYWLEREIDSEYFAMTTQGNIKVIQSPIKSRSVNLAIVVSDSAGHETTSVLEILIVHPHSVPPKDCPKKQDPIHFLGPAPDGSTIIKFESGYGEEGAVIYNIKTNRDNLTIPLKLKGGGADIYLDGTEVKLFRRLDFRRKSVYKLFVTLGKRNGNPGVPAGNWHPLPRYLKVNFTVEVIDTSTEPPTLYVISGQPIKGATTKAIPEELPIGYVIGQIRPMSHEFSFNIKGPQSTYLSINNSSGELSIATRIDRDGEDGIKNLTFTLVVLQRSTTMDFVVLSHIATCLLVSDINDNAPTFSKGYYNVSVIEKNKKVLLDIPCYDADAGGNGECEVRLSGDEDADARFKIEGTELIAMADTIHYDPANNPIAVKVLAVDKPPKGNIARHGHTTVFVTVLPRNDYVPVWTHPQLMDKFQFLPISIEDGIRDGSTITVFKANDADRHSDLVFKLNTNFVVEHSGVFPTRAFSVNSKTGELVTYSPDDIVGIFLHDSYNLNMSVSDGRHTTFGTIEIKVFSINKYKPEFNQLWYVVSDTPIGGTVLEFKVKDRDEVSNITVQFFENEFSIDREEDWVQSSTNFKVVKLHTTWRLLKRSSENSYEGVVLLLRAKDGGVPERYGMSSVVFKTSNCDEESKPNGTDSEKTKTKTSNSLQDAPTITPKLPPKTSHPPPELSPSRTVTSPSRTVTSSSFFKTSPSSSKASKRPQNPSGLPQMTWDSEPDSSKWSTPPPHRESSQLQPVTSSTSVTTSYVKVSGGLILQSFMFTDISWEAFYKDSEEGRRIMSDIGKQLTSVFSTTPAFETAKVEHLNNANGCVIAKYTIHFSEMVDSATLDRVFKTLEKKPLHTMETEYMHGAAATCGRTNTDNMTSSSSSLGLKVVCIVEGLLLVIIIVGFVVSKRCKKAAKVAPDEEDKYKEAYRTAEKLKERARNLENELNNIQAENVKLRLSITEANLTIVDEVHVRDMKKRASGSQQFADLGDQDSAFWSTTSGKSESVNTGHVSSMDDTATAMDTDHGDGGGEGETEETIYEGGTLEGIGSGIETLDGGNNDDGENEKINDEAEKGEYDEVGQGESNNEIENDKEVSYDSGELKEVVNGGSERSEEGAKDGSIQDVPCKKVDEPYGKTATEDASKTRGTKRGTRRKSQLSDIVLMTLIKKQSLSSNEENQKLAEVREDDTTVEANVNSESAGHGETVPDEPEEEVIDDSTLDHENAGGLANGSNDDDEDAENAPQPDKTEKTIPKGGFCDVVIDALRFKYVFDEVEGAKSNIPVIYTKSKNNTPSMDGNGQLNAVHVNREEANNLIGMSEERKEQDHSEVMDEDNSARPARKESILSVLESTFDCKQEAPSSTLDDRSGNIDHDFKEKEDCLRETGQGIPNIYFHDAEELETNTGRSSYISDVHDFYDGQMKYVDDMNVHSAGDFNYSTSGDAQNTLNTSENNSDSDSKVYSKKPSTRKSPKTSEAELKQNIFCIEETEERNPNEGADGLSKDSLTSKTSGKKSKQTAPKLVKKKKTKKDNLDDSLQYMTIQADTHDDVSPQQSESSGDLQAKKKCNRKKMKPDALGTDHTVVEVDTRGGVCDEHNDHPQEEKSLSKGKKSKQKIPKKKTQLSGSDKHADDCQEVLAGKHDLTSATADDIEKDDSQFEETVDIPSPFDVQFEYGITGASKTKTKMANSSKGGKFLGVKESGAEGSVPDDCGLQQTEVAEDLSAKQGKPAKQSTEKPGKRRKKKDV